MSNCETSVPVMDEFTAEAFVNRDEPIPVLTIPGNDPTAEPRGKRDRLKEALSNTTSKVKDKLQENTTDTKDYGYSLQDRLFAK